MIKKRLKNNIDFDGRTVKKTNPKNVYVRCRFEKLKVMSQNNKIRFIYKQNGGSDEILRLPCRTKDEKSLRGQEETFRLPSRQEDFNSGIRYVRPFVSSFDCPITVFRKSNIFCSDQ